MLILSLTDERERWAEEKISIHLRKGQLPAETVFASVFLNLCSPFSYQMREKLLEGTLQILRAHEVSVDLSTANTKSERLTLFL
jgi:hypothetical protein